MTCSPAQLAANRRNGALSRGPLSSTSKEITRRNGLKHGLTGEGIVIPTEDAEEVDRRLVEFEAEYQPRTPAERELVKRIALMTVRLDRSAEHEAKAIAFRMRNAVAEFDDARLAEVEHLFGWIASEPATHARRLRRSPEGIARLIEAVEGLRSDLAHPQGYRWDHGHCEQFHHFLGQRTMDLPVSRPRALTEAICGRFHLLREADGQGLEIQDRRLWAIGQMVELIDAEIARLKELLEGFDRASLDLDRSEAPARAIFDASKEAVLARKYEAASERALFKALRELREIQENSTQIEAEESVAPDPVGELGSLSPEAPSEVEKPTNLDATVPEPEPTSERKRPNLEKLARKGRRRA